MKLFAILALTAGLLMAQNQTNRTGSVNPSATDMLNSMGSTVTPGNQTAPEFPKPENAQPVAERQAPPPAPAAETAQEQTAAAAPAQEAAPTESAQPAPEPQQATQATPPAQPEPSTEPPAETSSDANRSEVANNEMPATSLNWLGLILGGGALSAAGLFLHRKRS
jgi:hypothetical protein